MNLLPPPIAYTPFWDPCSVIAPDFDRYWLALVIPLVIAVCLVYKGTRVSDVRTIPKATAIMVVQVFIVMTIAALGINGLFMLIVKAH